MHWIARVARDASLPRGDQLEIPAQASAEEVWGTVMATCGVSETELAKVVADWFRLDVADLAGADPSVTKLITGAVARSFSVFPLE